MIYLRDVGYNLPKQTMSTAEIATSTGSDVDFLREKVGVHSRHFLSRDEAASDMAACAVEDLMYRNPDLDRAAVELLVVVTQNPDYRLPHMGAQLQQRCGFSDRVASFDVGLGCSGYVYALSIARGLLVSEGGRDAVVVTADPYSKIMDPKDRATMPVFGDAATATWLSTAPGPTAATIGKADFGTDGSGAMDLVVVSGGSARPLGGIWKDELSRDTGVPQLHMQGRAIFNFLQRRAPISVKACLERNGLTIDDIDVFLFHQASRYLLESLVDRMGLERDKVWIDIADVGNTVSSTIPLTLARRREAGFELAGKRVLISGFGVGLSWATNVLQF